MVRVLRLLTILLSPALASAQAVPDMTVFGKSVSPTTIHVTSRIVYVDVVVRDSSGHIVHGLTEKDFNILEDGKPQPINFFRDHTHDALTPIASTAIHDATLSFSNVAVNGDGTQSVNIILFDLFNTAAQDQAYARQQMIRFLEQLPPGRQTALFILGARLQMLQSFTGSTDRLLAAARAVKTTKSTVETLGEQQQDLSLASALATAGHSTVSDGFNLQQGQDVQRATDITKMALDQIAAAVSGYPGRKNLYWLGETFPVYGPTLEIHDLSEAVISNTLSTSDMADANRAEATAQIAIYPISLQGLEVGGSGPESDLEPAGTELERQFTRRNAMHEMLNNLAETTGGHAYYGTNDFARALQRGFEDGASYYSLAYRSQNKSWNGHFRKIAVKVEQHSYPLAYRRGYYALPDQPAIAGDVISNLDAALQQNAPELTVLRLHAKVELPDAQHANVRVDSVIEPVHIDFSTDAQGKHHAQLLVTLVALPDTHPSTARTKQQPAPVPMHRTSGAYIFDLDQPAFEKLFTSGMPMHQELALPPGRYRLRLGVSDLRNHRIGTLDMPIEIASSK
jgi:VWFA-related protein